MASSYSIKQIKSKTGERFSYLLGESNLPLYYPTIYTFSELRAKGLSLATISHYLSAIQLLHIHLDLAGIDMEARLAKGEFLSLPEIDDLVRSCFHPTADLKHQLELKKANVSAMQRGNVRSINTHSVGTRVLQPPTPDGMSAKSQQKYPCLFKIN